MCGLNIIIVVCGLACLCKHVLGLCSAHLQLQKAMANLLGIKLRVSDFQNFKGFSTLLQISITQVIIHIMYYMCTDLTYRYAIYNS